MPRYELGSKFRTGGLEKANARAIAKARIPAIEHLDVWYGDSNYGGDATVKDVALLLARSDLPRLRHLGVMDTQFSDELPALLSSSPLVKQVKELDLSLGTLTDEGAKALVARRDAFAHLDVLDVSCNYLSAAAVKSLKGCAKRVVSRKQRDDPATIEDEGVSYRHPAITE